MHKIKKCSKLCVFLQSHKKIFSSCGFAFLKRIDYKGVTAFIAVGLFLLVKIIRVYHLILYYIYNQRI